ncbi:ROK family protein [Streptomyces sp. NPDC001401]|uniref:ROK family protein n=1 Tax=Streptomyces sp. NPDC001401 TaxID=3364570 RepID=UPI003680F844
MFEWLDRLIGMADDVRPEEAKRLVRLSTISVIAAVVWAVAVIPVAHGVVVWVPAFAFGFIAVVALAIAVVRTLAAGLADTEEAIREVRTQLQTRTPSGRHIGCRVGRRRLECGLLHVTEETTALPDTDQIGAVHDERDVVRANADDERFRHDELFDAIGDALKEQIERAFRKDLEIESIGLALPGGIVPDRGDFARTVEGVPLTAGEHVTSRIADTLIEKCGTDMLRKVFRTDEHQPLSHIIHLDNDARCAARWLITAEGADWRDFVCVFAGTGVGSGLVLDRHVYYGAKFRAGEVGHVDLNIGDAMVLGGKSLPPSECSCGRRGYHFESLVGIGGLGQLARTLDAASLTAILERYCATSHYEDFLAKLDPDEGAGMTLLRLFRDTDDELRSIRRDFHPYLDTLMKLYGRLFGVGITAILDVLDLPHVALCGTVPEYLRGHAGFVDAVQGHLAANVMGGVSDPLFGRMRAWGWRGAALLARDPDYLKRRFL